MKRVAQCLNVAPDVTLTPELTRALHPSRAVRAPKHHASWGHVTHSAAPLVYACASCKGSFDEETVEAVLHRAAANTHGPAIAPTLQLALAC